MGFGNKITYFQVFGPASISSGWWKPILPILEEVSHMPTVIGVNFAYMYTTSDVPTCIGIGWIPSLKSKFICLIFSIKHLPLEYRDTESHYFAFVRCILPPACLRRKLIFRIQRKLVKYKLVTRICESYGVDFVVLSLCIYIVNSVACVKLHTSLWFECIYTENLFIYIQDIVYNMYVEYIFLIILEYNVKCACHAFMYPAFVLAFKN